MHRTKAKVAFNGRIENEIAGEKHCMHLGRYYMKIK